MGQAVYETSMALQFVPILLSVLLAVFGLVLVGVGRGWTATEPSYATTCLGACTALLAVPASQTTASVAATLLVITGFAVLTACLTVIVSFSLLRSLR